MPSLYRIFRDQDRILGQQTYQHDQAHLYIDIVVEAKDLQEEEYPEYTCRYGEYDRKRQNIAFILRSQQEVYKYEAQDKDEDDLRTCCLFLPGDTGVFITPAVRQYLGRRFVDGPDRITGAIARFRTPVNRCRVIEVVVAHCLRSIYLAERDQLVYRYHLTLVVLDIDARKRLFVVTIRDIGLRHHPVVFTKPVEVIDEAATIIDLHRLHQIGDGYTHLFGLVVVHVHHVLRVAGGKRGEGIRDLRPLHQRSDELIGHSAQPVHRSIGLILQRELEAGHVTKTLDGRESEEERVGILDLLGDFHGQQAADRIDVFYRSAFIYRFHPHETRAIRRGIGICNEVQRFHIISAVCNRRSLDDAVDLGNGFVRLVQTAAGRRVHGIQDKALVFRGNKAAGRPLHDHIGAAGKYYKRGDGDPFVTEKEPQAAYISIRHGLETCVEGSIEPGEESFPFSVFVCCVDILQEDRTKRGAERQRIHGRDKDGDSQRIPELPVEYTRGAFHKAHRDEHRRHYQRDRYDSAGDLTHRLKRGLFYRQSRIFHFRVHGLHDYDGVIHHDTYRQHEGE